MAEWGDRSQLATFALAADRSASAVCLGATLEAFLIVFSGLNI